jgi:hypothetical protein
MFLKKWYFSAFNAFCLRRNGSCINSRLGVRQIFQSVFALRFGVFEFSWVHKYEYSSAIFSHNDAITAEYLW